MTSFNRRGLMLASAAAGLVPGAFAQGDQSMRPSRLRHYVIAARDLEAVCNQIYSALDLEPTPKGDGPEPTLAFGFART